MHNMQKNAQKNIIYIIEVGGQCPPICRKSGGANFEKWGGGKKKFALRANFYKFSPPHFSKPCYTPDCH